VSTDSERERIAAKAYEVYERRVRNGIPGDQQSDWAQAEREVAEEMKKNAAKAKAPESKPVPVSAPKVEIKPVAAAPAVKEPPKAEVKPAPKAEEKAPPKVESKPVVSPVKTVVAKKAVKK
jgi:hypothetical protein